MAKKKTGKKPSSGYPKKHPKAGIAEIRKETGRRLISSSTASNVRKRLGIGNYKGFGAIGYSSRKKRPLEANRPESRAATLQKSLTATHMVLEVMKLSERAGGMDRLRKAVDFCKRLEDFE